MMFKLPVKLFEGTPWQKAIEEQSANGFVFMETKREERAKSEEQNKTFHKLLSLFERSGCASSSGDSLKNYYKGKGGLRITGYNLTFDDKKGKERCVFMRLIKGDDGSKTLEGLPDHWLARVEKVYCSWSDATLKQGERAITCLIHDMNEAGVRSSRVGKEFEEMMLGIEKNAEASGFYYRTI